MPVLTVAVVLLLVSVSAFAALSFHDFSEPRPSGERSLESFDAQSLSLSGSGIRDTDLDGAPDALENFVGGSDPLKWNSSGTRIPDGWLIRYGLDPLDPDAEYRFAAKPPPDALSPAYQNAWPAASTPTLWEVYSWNRSANWNETTQGPYESGLDPTRWDSSGDGIPDGWLMRYGLDPFDGNVSSKRLAGPEGLTVREAFEHDTDPTRLDTDGDGIRDRQEIDGPLDPSAGPDDPPRFPPSDPRRFSTTQSGVCDGYLVAHGLDPTDPENAYGDLGRSGATTLESFLWSQERFGPEACTLGRGLDPTAGSTIGGPIPDGWLLRYGLDPLDPAVPAQATQSTAQHSGEPLPTEAPDQPPLPPVSLTVLDEYLHGRPAGWDEATMGPWWGGTDPSRLDTDRDGLIDSVEMRGYYLEIATEVGPTAPVRPMQAASDPVHADSDGDGLTDLEEITQHGTDPSRRDTDMDGIPDAVELDDEFGLDPVRADTAGDFLRDGARLDMLASRVRQYLEDGPLYEYPGEPGVSRTVMDWAIDLPGAEGVPSLSLRGVADLLGPRGNADGDTDEDGAPLINILDPDMDGDGLLNGWEVDPVLYRHSQFGAGRVPRPGTDPLNPDTDGDGLREGWEVEHGLPVVCAAPCRSGYSMDPSRWDSDGDGISDAREDPDGDSVEWVFYQDRSGVIAPPNPLPVWAFPNELEQQADTDPNRFDSRGDGLGDGWKVFWSQVYPGLGADEVGLFDPIDPDTGRVSVPAGATKPSIELDQSDVVLSENTYTRFLLDEDDMLEGESLVKVHEGVPDLSGDGNLRDVYEVEGTVRFGFREAHDAGTNPYLTDTSGDDVPDWWAYLYRTHLPNTPLEEAQCTAGQRLDPLVHYPADAKAGQLSVRREYAPEGGPSDGSASTNPLCSDTDLDGLLDAYEAAVGLDPLDPSDGDLDSKEDSDGDGLTDVEEILGVRYSHTGSRFIRTDPGHPDSDGDGLLDGRDVALDPGNPDDEPWMALFLDLGITYDRDPSGRFHFLGEADLQTDPTDPDDSGTTVPAGWLTQYGLPTQNAENHRERYSARLPAWWDLEVHGPWWGGVGPNDDLPPGNDLDGDGLQDHEADGSGFEDPFPAANTPNEWPQPDWDQYPAIAALEAATSGDGLPADAVTDASVDPLLRRLLAQTYLNERVENDQGYQFLPPPTPSHESPCFDKSGTNRLRLVDAGGQATDTLVKGEPVWLHGRLRDCDTGAALHGVTVEARFNRPGEPSQGFGAGFTQADGTFGFPVNITSQHSVSLPAPSLPDDPGYAPVVLRGATSGTVEWRADPSIVEPGERFMEVRSYASPDSAPFNDTRPPLSAAVESYRVTIEAESVLTLDAPLNVTTGGPFRVGFRLADSGGTPLQDRLVFTWPGGNAEATPAPDGTGRIDLAAPHSLKDLKTLRVRSHPVGDAAQYVEPAQEERPIRLLNPVQIRFTDLATGADAGGTLDVRGTVLLPSGAGAAGIPLAFDLVGGSEHTPHASTTSGAGGTFHAELSLPTTMTNGPSDLIVTAEPTKQTAGLVVSEPVTVRSLPVFTGVSSGNITQGDPVEVTGGLIEPDAVPVTGATVRVTLDGVERTNVTDGSGRFLVTFPPDTPLRPVLQSIRFAGDELHVSAVHQSERTVSTGTRLDAASGESMRGMAVDLPIRLTAGDGLPVAGAPIHVRWGQEPPLTVLTDEDGEAVFHRAGDPGDPLGPVTVRARYNGSADGGRAASESVVIWNVTTEVEMIVPSGVFEAGRPIPEGVLRDAGTGAPLAGFQLTVRVEPGQNRTVTTGEDGRFPVVEKTQRTDSPAVLGVNVSFSGSGPYGPASVATTLAIRAPARLDIDAPSVLVQGTESLAHVRVQGLDGNAVDGGTVEALLDGVVLGDGAVVEGLARVILFVGMNATTGPRDIQFHFSGTEDYAPSTQEEPVQIKRPASISLSLDPGKPGSLARVQVTATSGTDPVPFSEVYLQVEGLEGGLVATTDEDGVATFTVQQPLEEARMSVRFQGDSQLSHAHVTGSLVPVQPKAVAETATEWTMWVSLVAFLLTCTLSFLVYRLRRNPLAPVFRKAWRIVGARGPYEEQILRAYRELEYAAIGHDRLPGAAPTPRVLQEAVAKGIPASAHDSLDRLVALFEIARYGTETMGPEHQQEALACLEAIQDTLKDDAGLTWWRRTTRRTGVPA